MRRAEVIDGLERNWREEKRLIDEKSINNGLKRNGRLENINNRRAEAERVTRTAETIDGLERNRREEKLLINETIDRLKQNGRVEEHKQSTD